GGSSSPASAGGLDIGSLASLLTGFSGRSMPAELDWVDTELIANNAKKIVKNCIDPARIVATEKNGKKVLELDEAEWNVIPTVELNVYVKHGNGYIDMGLDNTFDWYDDNSIALDFDGTWLTLNGKACAYYLVSDTKEADGSWTTIGRIPARLNGQFVNLQVVFDKANPNGTVTGAYPLYEDDSIDVQAKGNIEVKAGDKIELLCDYYSLDGTYSDTYSLGEKFTVPQSGLTLENLKLNAKDVSATYRITDIYGNYFWVSAD
ncbi:MAG: peptidase C11, partial [Clostridia bacterium]|nr:peptidase C11 [Clostridia bacterium]